jgi:hypothetical protein
LPLIHIISYNITSYEQEEAANANIIDGNDILPAAQIGFKRWLTTMYCHTGAHIVAAPMAHYMALHGSRFKYSHRLGYFPVHGIENFILGNKTIMQFKKIKNKKVLVHHCMNYIYRPTKLEGLCAYAFWARIYETKLPKKGRTKQHEDMEYNEAHPAYKVFTLQEHKEELIPYFAWNFLPSTSTFKTSIMFPVNTEDVDYIQKEAYCRRFLILFVSFRKKEDLLKNGSYTSRMQEAISDNLISDDMIKIADNIQTIHNSLSSPMVANILTSTTVMDDPEECDADNEENAKNANDILLRIGTALASSSVKILTQEATDLYPIFGKRVICQHDIDLFGAIPDAFDTEGEHPNGSNGNEANIYGTERYSTKTSTLNRLVMKTFLSTKEMEKKSSGSTSTVDNMEKVATKQVEAIGTWQSIVAWGRVNGLDCEQQTAFEILTATFVLSFYNGKSNDVPPSMETEEQGDALRKLARQKEDSKNNMVPPSTKAAYNDLKYSEHKHRPLRLFLTGPAGAGKCKFHETIW